MTWPGASMGFVITMVQRAAASMTRLNDIFDATPSILTTDKELASPIKGEITFDAVRFTHENNDKPALENVSFTVPAGTTFAIVGRTGAGKTTLVELIPRLLDVESGRLLIDGINIKDIPVGELRRAIGYVPQDVFLFSETLAENISFGQLGAPVEKIEQAALEADILANIESFEKGFETFVGERGITLSGGQKQRTSIARALIREPKILILDDALSAVDVETERTILGHLKSHFGKRTIGIVSHRISAVQDADLIIVLDDGKVIEQGNHASLLEEGGFYASLFTKQQLEKELEDIE